MTEHERLMENYEDALLRLLMENAARAEGERLIAQLGPAPRLPEPDALSDTLRRHYRRERWRKAGAAAGGFLRRTAVFACLGVLLFTSAMAASETFRASVRLKVGTAPMGVGLSVSAPRFEASWLPWGFELKFSDDGPTQYRRYYADASGSFIDASCLYLGGRELDMDLTAEEVLDVRVKNREASLLASGGTLRLVMPVEEQGCVILVLSSGVAREDLLRTAERLICPWEA